DRVAAREWSSAGGIIRCIGLEQIATACGARGSGALAGAARRRRDRYFSRGGRAIAGNGRRCRVAIAAALSRRGAGAAHDREDQRGGCGEGSVAAGWVTAPRRIAISLMRFALAIVGRS